MNLQAAVPERARIDLCTSILIVANWSAMAAAEPVVLLSGFSISEEAGSLVHPTQIAFGPDGRLYVGTLPGSIFAYEYGAGGIIGPVDTVATDVGVTLLGIGFDSDGYLYASSNEGAPDTGFLARLLDEDGDGFHERQQQFVTGLPNKGHHNDQLAIDDRVLYVGMGSRTDDGEQDDVQPIPAATLLRIDLDTVDFDSSDNLPEVYAYGLRNAFGIALDDQHRVWVGDNGRDTPLEPDELNLVLAGAHYGFPVESAPPDAIPPVVTLGFGTSADGLDFYPATGPWGAAFAGDIFQARFDFEFNDPGGPGRDVVRCMIEEKVPNEPTAVVEVFANGFYQPLDVEVDPFGQLLVMEYGSYDGTVPGRIFRIAIVLPSDTDADGDVDLVDFGMFQACFTGPAPGSLPAECQPLDFDTDGDIDLADYSAFQATFTGP